MRLLRFWMQVQFRSLWREGQARLTTGVMLVMSIGLGLFSAGSLAAQVAQWELAGSELLAGRLWLLCVAAWVGMGFMALLGTVKKAFSDEETLLLCTLPIAPAGRLRALYGWLLSEHLGNLFLLTAITLGAALGSRALPWLLLLLSGSALAALLALIGLFTMVKYVLPRGWRGLVGAVIALVGLLGGVAAAWQAGLLPATWPAPGVIGLGLLVGIGLLLGPMGAPLGRLYEAAFQVAQGWDRRQRVRTLPGLGALLACLVQQRNAHSALLVKELLQRSRSRLTVLRLLVLPLYLLLFVWLYPLAAARGLPDGWLVIAFATGLVILGGIIDSNPSPIGSEGNRLTLLLVAPLSLADILRAKLTSFFWPLLAFGVLTTLLLGVWVGLPLLDLAQSLAAVALILLGQAALFAWGSVWEEELDLPVSGEAQMFIQEEVPVTPVRLALIQLGLLLLAAMLAVLWYLPLALVLPILALVDGIVMTGAWQVGQVRLQRLVR